MSGRGAVAGITRVAAAAAFASWVAFGAARAAEPPTAAREPALSWTQAKRLAEVIDRLEADYVEALDDRRLVDDALRGVLAGLDPYSAYLSPTEYAALGEFTDEALPGAPEAPAAPRDAAPGEAAPRTGPDAAPAESARHGAPSVIATLARSGFAHLRVRQFNAPTPRELEREVLKLAAAAPLAGAVLDLRGNPGGVFDAGVAVADQFLDAGVIVASEGRAADASFVRHATPGDLLHGAPLIVLVDGATASAAEVVVAALQDGRRALVLGERTFGKGSVQSVIPLRSGGAVKFTTARYRTPAGRVIQGVGIEPDLPLAAFDPLPGVADPALERALDAIGAVARSR